ncbi:MAG: hypothetical protein ABIT38_11675, partial [Gemmatimonadaceae bacterium]
SRDGRELFFRKGDTLFATTVDLRDPPTVGTPKALFVGQYQSSLHQALYDPSPNGQEFVMVKQVGGDAGLTVHFVLKWFDRRGKVAIH